MDFRQIIGLSLQLLTKVRLPTGAPPPEPDIAKLYRDSLAQVSAQMPAPSPESVSMPVSSLSTTAPLMLPASGPPSETENPVAIACVPCLRAHVSAAAGLLTEALRMARGDSITHPEVADRINMAQGEIVSAERKDLTPEAILRAPQEEKQIIEWFLPRVRELRQHIILIASEEDLLKVSAEANGLGRDLTLRHLEARGVDIKRLETIAEQVGNDEITIEEAQRRVKELVPK